MRCATFDIETSGLEAVGAGFLLCVVIKPLDRKHITLRYDKLGLSPGKEKLLVEMSLDELGKYDLLIGHNIISYDLAWLRSRATQFGIAYNLEPFAYDTLLAFRRVGYKTVPGFKGNPRASLGHVVDFFGVTVQKKYPIFPRQHWKAVWEVGEEREKAMNHIVSHCVADVYANEQIYWPIMKADRVWGLRRVR